DGDAFVATSLPPSADESIWFRSSHLLSLRNASVADWTPEPYSDKYASAEGPGCTCFERRLRRTTVLRCLLALIRVQGLTSGQAADSRAVVSDYPRLVAQRRVDHSTVSDNPAICSLGRNAGKPSSWAVSRRTGV